jgi:PiT family inorganic phosphate transporter
MSYLISIWLLNASKNDYPKLFTAIMGITIWFVESQMKYYDAIEKPRFDSHFWSVAFESHNLKWFW